jgi:hypothetical protein
VEHRRRARDVAAAALEGREVGSCVLLGCWVLLGWVGYAIRVTWCLFFFYT